jgi:2-polyprenyl-3-methyl-5-hydroxy-6-metoxy-1,4-benzoquinol methylase
LRYVSDMHPVTSTPPALDNRPAQFAPDQIRSVAAPSCVFCGRQGREVYAGLADRLFSAPGQWNLKRCPNPECGELWLDPMPIPEDIGRAYETYYTHSSDSANTESTKLAHRIVRIIRRGYLARKYAYDEVNSGSLRKTFSRCLGLLAYLNPFRRAWLDFSMMYLTRLEGGRLLEVGCGSGGMLKGLADLGWEVAGVDFDPVAVAACRSKGLRVELGTLEDQLYPRNSFDALVMSHVIEHVHDPVALLSECRRILAPGGKLSLTTPHLDALGHRLFRSSWFCLDPPRHLHLFSVKSLRAALREAGFTRVRIFTTMRDASEAFIASRSIQRTGRFQMGSAHKTTEAMFGILLQLIEWSLLKVGFVVGEELSAIAQKDSVS